MFVYKIFKISMWLLKSGATVSERQSANVKPAMKKLKKDAMGKSHCIRCIAMNDNKWLLFRLNNLPVSYFHNVATRTCSSRQEKSPVMKSKSNCNISMSFFQSVQKKKQTTKGLLFLFANVVMPFLWLIYCVSFVCLYYSRDLVLSSVKLQPSPI